MNTLRPSAAFESSERTTARSTSLFLKASALAAKLGVSTISTRTCGCSFASSRLKAAINLPLCSLSGPVATFNTKCSRKAKGTEARPVGPHPQSRGPAQKLEKEAGGDAPLFSTCVTTSRFRVEGGMHLVCLHATSVAELPSG